MLIEALIESIRLGRAVWVNRGNLGGGHRANALVFRREGRLRLLVAAELGRTDIRLHASDGHPEFDSGLVREAGL